MLFQLQESAQHQNTVCVAKQSALLVLRAQEHFGIIFSVTFAHLLYDA